MISIIICSANQQLLIAVKQNIADTVGVPFEIIAIDNRNSTNGICEVYNRGLYQAKYDLLCFMHEDIILKTPDWGLIISQLFTNNPDIGLVGVAGSFYKPLVPSSWRGATQKTECLHILQGSKSENPDEFTLFNINPYNSKIAEVASVDGVWFCTTKTIAKKYPFDEHTFKKFHCYDIDFSIAIGQEYKIVVTYDILLAHLSKGSFDRTWVMETLKLHKKWRHRLPILRGNLSEQETDYIEKYTFRHFLKQVTDLNLPLSLVKNVLWEKSFFEKISFKLWFNLNFHLYKHWKKSLKDPDYHPMPVVEK